MRQVRFVLLLLASTALFSWPVFADTVSIGLSQNGGAITTVASGTGSASFDGPFGTFSLIHATGEGQSVLTPPDILFSDSIQTATSSGGGLQVFITDQGLTSPLGTVPFTSSFTANVLPSGWTMTESTLISLTNGVYVGAPLGSANFSAIGTNVQTENGVTGSGPYSVTEVFTVLAVGAGDDNLTIDLSATPVSTAEPNTLMLIGTGLLGIAYRRKRRVRKSY